VLAEAIKRDAKTPTLYLLRIALNIERDERALVERDFAELFKIEPNEPAHRIALARVYVSWKSPAAAELALRDAVRVAPKNEALKSLLITFLRTQRDFADAEKSFKELIAAAPTDHIYNHGLAGLYLQHDLTDKAQAIYEAIIASEKDPRRVLVARNALGRLKLAKGDVAAARQQIDLVFKVDPKNEGASLLRGQIDFNAQNHEAVIARMRNLVRDHPKAIGAYRLLAEAYVRTNRLDLAADTLGSALSQAPRDNRVRLRLAEVYILQERYDAAFEIANALAENSEVASDAQRIRAEIYTRTRRYQEALAALEKLRARGTNEAQLEAMRGQVLLRSGDHAGAATAFERAVELGLTRADVVTGLISAQIALTQFDAAEARLTALLGKEPNQAYLHNLMGELNVRQSRSDDARARFAKASELDPRWSIPYLNLSNLLIASGKSDEGIAVLKAGVEKAPADELLSFALGLAYHRAEKVGEAAAVYERLLKANPNLAGAANNLAVLLVDYGKPDQAALDRALALVLRFKDSTNSSLLDTLGWVHYRRGEFAQAIEYLKRSVAAAPDSAEPRYHLGMAYLRNGQPQLAKAELERSVAAGAKFRGVEEARQMLARLAVETAQ
jgi:predicted Zn-dependent protease